MAEFLSNVALKDLAPILVLVLCFLAAMIIWLSLQWRLHRRTEFEVALKQEMLNRGMSAADIERVLKASMTSADPPPRWWQEHRQQRACRRWY
jgi:hypothetical protein